MAPKADDFLSAADLNPPPYSANNGPHPRFHGRKHIFPRRMKRSPALGLLSACAVAFFWLGSRNWLETVGEAEASATLQEFETSLGKCALRFHSAAEPEPATRLTNPRYNDEHGQQKKIILRNATLFDGEDWASGPVDIAFEKGLIVDVTVAGTTALFSAAEGVDIEVHGRYVTPGLVDMHSHHYIGMWPEFESVNDDNEMSDDFGALTPFVRVIDSMKAYDPGAEIIASGGITTSLILPGSANTMGGEAVAVKNRLKSGPSGEYVVEELLLESGIPKEDRHRWMKMACGENPRRVYKHTRMGLAWILRKHLARAQELAEKQDAWCESASGADTAPKQASIMERLGKYPEELELESTVGLIRGQVAMHNHCYEPEDFETMLRVIHEFGIQVKAFHHAIEAWQVPHMLKELAGNVTIATFAEFSLYKHEAYYPSLEAGAILTQNGLNVAYKSDHVTEETNAKYVMSQAASGHAFGLSDVKALQAVTSIPAKAMDVGFRVGYARPGYDADIVVWDSHPLSNGATPLQVFIDGVATLDEEKVKDSMGVSLAEAQSKRPNVPTHRVKLSEEAKEDVCKRAEKKDQTFIINGIQKTFLGNYPELAASVATAGMGKLTLVVHANEVLCLGTAEACGSTIAAANANDAVVVELQNGHLMPGLIGITSALGMSEIAGEEDSGNGIATAKDNTDASNVDFAKYGIALDGKAFERARIGGVSRAITAPLASDNLVQGVSVEILTSGKKGILDGGIVQGDVALHFIVDVGSSEGSTSMEIMKIRKILAENQGKGNETVYGRVADGLLPLVIQVDDKYLTEQVIAIKKDFPAVNIVITGAHSAPVLADEIAAANISVLLSWNRGAPDSWSKKDTMVGPPLTRSPASILSEAGVLYAVATAGEAPLGDSRIHDLALEAAWAAKYAGLSDNEAVALVSSHVEKILSLQPSCDIVIWENDPLEYGGRVVLSFDATKDGKLQLGSCWPEESK